MVSSSALKPRPALEALTLPHPFSELFTPLESQPLLPALALSDKLHQPLPRSVLKEPSTILHAWQMSLHALLVTRHVALTAAEISHLWHAL